MGQNPPNYPASALLSQFNVVAGDVVRLGEAMPASLYRFAPAQGMRTFSEQLMHLATVVFLTAALVRQTGSPYPPGEGDNGPGGVTEKDDVLAYLREAIAYGQETLEGLNEATARQQVPTYFGPQARVEVAGGLIYHSYNHYGQMAVYARLCGMIPPASLPPSSPGS